MFAMFKKTDELALNMHKPFKESHSQTILVVAVAEYRKCSETF